MSRFDIIQIKPPFVIFEYIEEWENVDLSR